MQSKSLSIKVKSNPLGATNISPADFPIGSPESRAVARSIATRLNKAPELSEEELRQRDVDKLCSEWVVSHKRGPMLWLRNYTATENYHHREQGLEPVAPFPFLPFTDRKIDLSALPFEHDDFGKGEPCENCKKCGFSYCIPDYLDVVMGYLLNTKLLWIPKTREMMTSWLVVGFITWFAQFYEKTEAVSQSEDDRKAMGLIKYANILYSNQETWMKERHQLKSGDDSGTLHDIKWANGSTFIAMPSGLRKLASSHPTIYFNDETAHQPGAEATINIAMPAVRQIVCVSSVAPSWFADVTGC